MWKMRIFVAMKWLRRYISLPLLLIVGFIVFVLFFNENSVMRSMEYASQKRELQVEIKNYEDTIRLYEELNRRLDSDPAELEKIVRVHYHMQRADEDVYVFD